MFCSFKHKKCKVSNKSCSHEPGGAKRLFMPCIGEDYDQSYQTGSDFCRHNIQPPWTRADNSPIVCEIFIEVLKLHFNLVTTQQDYYGRQCGILLHSYCTSTYTEVTVLLLWSSSNTTLEYPRRYSKRVAVWVLHGNSRVTSQEQHGYFSVGTSVITV